MERATYSVGNKTVDGFQVYALQEDRKAVAEIAPGLGNNCYAFRVADSRPGLEGGDWLQLIDGPPDLRTLQEHPDIYGIPVLFPFPNRIRGGRWRFEGETYQFDKPPDSPTSIHGLLLNRPYQVESHAADDNGAALVCTLNSCDFADIGRQYPFPVQNQDYLHTQRCRVVDGRVDTEYRQPEHADGVRHPSLFSRRAVVRCERFNGADQSPCRKHIGNSTRIPCRPADASRLSTPWTCEKASRSPD